MAAARPAQRGGDATWAKMTKAVRYACCMRSPASFSGLRRPRIACVIEGPRS